MISSIEEYDIDEDKWNIIKISGLVQWTPVEVAGCIQIKED